MKHSFISCILIALLATSCFSGKMMSASHYQEVFMGQQATDFEAKYGAPYEVHVSPNGLVEYIYIEHVTTGRKSSVMKEYVFVISDGKVIDKKTKETQSQSLQFSE